MIFTDFVQIFDSLDFISLRVQLSGINAVLYFTPQILMQSGAGDLLASIGINGESASILASGVTCLLMLPCILMAMWLMDKSGRRCVILQFHLSVFLVVVWLWLSYN